MGTATQSVLTALRIVEQVGARKAVGVSQLARQLDLPKSTVLRSLVTLREAGWVRQDAATNWVLTLRCAVIARRVMRESAVLEQVRPVTLELRDTIHETVRCFLIEGMNIVLIDTVESDHAVRAVEPELPGDVPIYATAIGKATLATLPPEVVEAVVQQPMSSVTIHTITDPDVLRRDIATTRRRGWSEIRGELYADLGGVAAAAPLSNDVLIGIGVSYPLHRTPTRVATGHGRAVRATAERLAGALGPILGPQH